jgi:hypothetical protein
MKTQSLSPTAKGFLLTVLAILFVLIALTLSGLVNNLAAQGQNTVYWVYDKGSDNSRFGYFNGTTALPVGPYHPGADIEGLACLNNTLYGSSGLNGHAVSSLYKVMVDIPNNLSTLQKIGDIRTAGGDPFYEVDSLAVKNDGSIWGYSDSSPRRGIIKIDPATGVAQLIVPASYKVEGLEWIGDTLWLAGDGDFYTWKEGGSIIKAFTVAGLDEVEALGWVNGYLYAGNHDDDRGLVAIDRTAGTVYPDKDLPAPDDIEGVTDCNPTAPPPPTVDPVPTAPPAAIYLSSSDNESVEGANGVEVHYRDEDILRCVPHPVPGNPYDCEWTTFFDGSDVGLASADLEDFEFLVEAGQPYPSIIFTLNKTFSIPNIGCSPSPLKVDDSDIVKFVPSSIGSNTAGCFSLYLKGADVGLTKGGEDIDALGFAPDGRLLISTIGSAKVPGPAGDIHAKDEDLLAYDLVKKEWSFYFDGSDIKLTRGGEDIAAVWVDNGDNPGGPPRDQNHYFSTKEDFDAKSVNSISGENDEIFGCSPLKLGDKTECFLYDFFKEIGADDQNLDDIDGIYVDFLAPYPLLGAAQTSVIEAAGVEDTPEEIESIDADDYTEAMSEADDEIDVYDFLDNVKRLHLPVISR